jgi:TonB family protein
MPGFSIAVGIPCHSIKQTAPRRKNFSLFAMNPAVAYLVLVRPMKLRRCVLIVIIWSLRASAQDSGASHGDAASASLQFQTLLNSIVLQSVVPALAKHQNLLNGNVTFQYRLDREGHLQDLKVVSSTSNRFVENTCLEMIRVTKFPPIPKEVIREQGRDWIELKGEVNIER